MKKSLIAAVVAAMTLSAVPAANAQSWSITIGSQDRYEQRYDRRHDTRAQDYRRHRAEERRFYSQQPTYWRGRCSRQDLIIRDPYTNRVVCVDRREYQRFYNRRQW